MKIHIPYFEIALKSRQCSFESFQKYFIAMQINNRSIIIYNIALLMLTKTIFVKISKWTFHFRYACMIKHEKNTAYFLLQKTFAFCWCDEIIE